MLQAARERNGLSQAQLARLGGTSQAHLSRIERGDVCPSLDTAARLLRAMGERLVISVEPAPIGNRTPEELRREFAGSTPEQRLADTAQLSHMLTGLAAAAHAQRTRPSASRP